MLGGEIFDNIKCSAYMLFKPGHRCTMFLLSIMYAYVGISYILQNSKAIL